MVTDIHMLYIAHYFMKIRLVTRPMIKTDNILITLDKDNTWGAQLNIIIERRLSDRL